MALQHAQALEIDDALRALGAALFLRAARDLAGWLARYAHADRSSASCTSNRAGRSRGGCGGRGKSSTSRRRMTGGFCGGRGSRRAGSATTATSFTSVRCPNRCLRRSRPQSKLAEEIGAVALKVGNDAASLLRPDKIVLYFSDLDRVSAAAAPARPRTRRMSQPWRPVHGGAGRQRRAPVLRYRSSAPRARARVAGAGELASVADEPPRRSAARRPSRRRAAGAMAVRAWRGSNSTASTRRHGRRPPISGRRPHELRRSRALRDSRGCRADGRALASLTLRRELECRTTITPSGANARGRPRA